jgi:hypothetical protein
MMGRLSRIYIVPSALSATDVGRLFNDRGFVPTKAQLALTKELLKGNGAVIDYSSELTQGTCLTSTNCRSIDQGWQYLFVFY